VIVSTCLLVTLGPDQVVTLQGQLGDALQDVGLAKRKEEGARGETTKVRPDNPG
jgi:hypothetical protein